MRCTCTCMIVCPAATPSLIPTLKPAGDRSVTTLSRAQRSARNIATCSSSVASNHDTTCLRAMTRTCPGEMGYASRIVSVSVSSATTRCDSGAQNGHSREGTQLQRDDMPGELMRQAEQVADDTAETTVAEVAH